MRLFDGLTSRGNLGATLEVACRRVGVKPRKADTGTSQVLPTASCWERWHEQDPY